MSPKKEVSCTDEHCPSHGSLKARGQVFEGIVIADKMQKTVRVEWSFLSKIKKYERYEKKRTRVLAHVPACMSIKLGDKVKIAECRPIARQVKFVVLEKL